MNRLFLLLLAFSLLSACTSQKWQEYKGEEFNIIENKDGKTLGYSSASGVKILTADGFAFKDLNKDGTLDKYEDWRLSYVERATDLATKLSLDEIAGLMLYSSHQSIPARTEGRFAGTYNGAPLVEGETDPAEVTDQQKLFLLLPC